MAQVALCVIMCVFILDFFRDNTTICMNIVCDKLGPAYIMIKVLLGKVRQNSDSNHQEHRKRMNSQRTIMCKGVNINYNIIVYVNLNLNANVNVNLSLNFHVNANVNVYVYPNIFMLIPMLKLMSMLLYFCSN